MIFDSFKTVFFIFIFYSILGWFIEVIRILIKDKKFVNRGFLIGPCCPIYGFGCLLITILLKDSVNDFSTLFLKSILICSVLEYFTSYIMEKIFKYRWWDYSKRKFNINGRICLETLVPFGIGSCIIMYFINPILFIIINSAGSLFSTILFVILFILIITDTFISCKLVYKIKGIEKNKQIDSTEKLNNKVKNIILNDNRYYKRIYASFPNLQTINKKNESSK